MISNFVYKQEPGHTAVSFTVSAANLGHFVDLFWPVQYAKAGILQNGGNIVHYLKNYSFLNLNIEEDVVIGLLFNEELPQKFLQGTFMYVYTNNDNFKYDLNLVPKNEHFVEAEKLAKHMLRTS